MNCKFCQRKAEEEGLCGPHMARHERNVRYLKNYEENLAYLLSEEGAEDREVFGEDLIGFYVEKIIEIKQFFKDCEN